MAVYRFYMRTKKTQAYEDVRAESKEKAIESYKVKKGFTVLCVREVSNG